MRPNPASPALPHMKLRRLCAKLCHSAGRELDGAPLVSGVSNAPLRQNLCDIAPRMQNGDDLQRLGLGPVDNQIRIDREKPHVGGSQVTPPMTAIRKRREIGKLAANDGFHAVGGFLTAFLLQVTPDANEV